MKGYEDYMMCSPMRDGEEMRDFLNDSRYITEAKAKAFWRDLMGTLWGDSETKSTHGIMSVELIADHMGISVETASEFLFACIRYNITERQGGGYVV